MRLESYTSSIKIYKVEVMMNRLLSVPKQLSLKAVAVGSLALMLVAMPQAKAVEPVQNFATCLVNKTSELDQVEMVQWIYSAMSAHPVLQPMTNISESQQNITNQRLARLYERLITQDCKTELKALAVSGQLEQGLEAGFAYLGETAMLKLMQDPSVLQTIEGYSQYLNFERFAEALGSDN